MNAPTGHPDAFIACCETGRRHAESFLVLLSTRPAKDRIALAILDWALHAIDDHQAHGMAQPACAGCWLFGKPPAAGMTAQRWWHEGHVHRVVHTLGIDRLLACAAVARDIVKEEAHRDEAARRTQGARPGTGDAAGG